MATPACFHIKVRPLWEVICNNTKCPPSPATIATPHGRNQYDEPLRRTKQPIDVLAMPESSPHVALKQLLVRKLREWCGASIDEYPSSGHELDIFAITQSGVSVYIEIIWTPTKTQFLSDMNMLQQSDANVKLVVVNRKIMVESALVREFRKVVLAQRKQGTIIHGDLLDGQQMLEDAEYVDYDLRKLIEQLLTQVQSQPKAEQMRLGMEILRVWKSNLSSNAAALTDSQRRLEKLALDNRSLDTLTASYPQLVDSMTDLRAQLEELNREIDGYETFASSKSEYLGIPDRLLSASLSPQERDEVKKSRELKSIAQSYLSMIDLKRKRVLPLVEDLRDVIDKVLSSNKQQTS